MTAFVARRNLVRVLPRKRAGRLDGHVAAVAQSDGSAQLIYAAPSGQCERAPTDWFRARLDFARGCYHTHPNGADIAIVALWPLLPAA